jgi:16S rRNA (adenine1518-N6/adenine1519-N6)-dimethyltransferase
VSHPASQLKALEMRARRRFGQNFLVNPDVVDRIVIAAAIKPGERVIEIGPGLGVLTRALLAAEADLVAVELDRDLADNLRTEIPGLKLVEADALKVEWVDVAPGEGWKVVANLPYNVATPLLMNLLRESPRFSTMVLMFQREVGNRLLADASDDAFGALSVQVQARANVRRVMELPPGAFHPAPKVHSVVLRFDVIAEPDFGGVTAAHFDRVVRLGFQHRRKMLINSLSTGLDKERALAALAEAGIPPSARAETIGLAGWRRLARAVHPG